MRRSICSSISQEQDFERLKGKALVVYYKKDVPMKPIIEHLRQREASVVREQVEKLKVEGATKTIMLKGDVVSIEEIANQRGAPMEAVKVALRDFKPEGYVRVGDRFFISRAKLDELDEKLRGIERLTEALAIIEASGVKEEGSRVLEALGYASIWEGMEMDKVRISKKTAAR